MKKLLTALLVLALMLGTCTVFAVTDGKAENDAFDLSNYFSDRDLAGTWEESGAVVVDLSGESGAVSLAEAGTYVLSGTLNGSVQVSVDSKDKVQLVLAGVNIASENAAAIYVENADKTFITLAADTENILTSTGFEEDNDIDAAIFSRDDLVLNGAGSLSVVSDKNGIVGKDDLKITGGSYTLTTAGRGIDGNDSVRIADGSFVITSGKDAIRSKNEEEGKGYVLIAGGTFDLTVGGGAENAAPHADDMMGFGRGGWGWGGNAAPADEENTASTKGTKAANSLTILDGTFSFNTADDALHTNGDLTVNGGSLILAAGDDGLHADGALTINDGDLTITQSYEGVEGTAITVNGGTVSLRAADDGLNAAGGNDASGFGRYDMFASDGISSIVINGGTLYVNADGDGIDSNGDLTVSGGVIVVSGPTNSGNGALDYNGNAMITGGTVIAAGAVGMAENFGTSSTQAAAMVTLSGNAGVIAVTDANGRELFSGTVEKSYQCVIISSPDLAVGETYTVSNGSGSTQVTLGSTVTGGGSGMGGFGGGRQQKNGGFGGGRQQMPDGQPMPDGQQMPNGQQMPQIPDGQQMPQMPGGFGGPGGQQPGGQGW